ncbi:AI-2E family transporter [Aliiruegeria sabulilitoris]|uniref:AI-2E family transporter n=1 Tax=Aliiruegeria sabulilitoris TaxID=1510458 RepID=UPI0009E950D9|nr:AI-2E family transporter [Aliiruegeria sabulilitoris]NDR55718.1 AI-2E family transporter [Pseudoruegeria sp. M32A2M]
MHSDPNRLQLWFLGIIAFAVILFLLVQAKFILISFSIALMLFSLTSGAIGYLQTLRIGQARLSVLLASILAVSLIAAVLISLSVLVLTQTNVVVSTVLQYSGPAREAVAEIFGWIGDDAEAAVLSWLSEVKIAPWLATVAGQAGNLASGTVLVILFIGFLFLERVWFSNKLENLLDDPARAHRIEAILSSIVHRVNRYLVVKAAISTITGALVYLMMRLLGLELAFAMGVLTFILNFIPNIGSIVATLVVALVGYVQTGEQFTGLALLSVIGALQFTVGQVLEPLLLGNTLQLSSLGIILSLAFWAAVWGVLGMFLAVPIMVAIMIICSHVPRLRPIAILLSQKGLPDLAGHRDAAGLDATDIDRKVA